MIVVFKTGDIVHAYTESNLKSIIVGERIQGASDFEFTLNSYDGDIGDVLYQSVYINGVQYVATDIEYLKDEETEQYVVSGVSLGDYLLDISIAKEDYAYNPGEIGEYFLYRVLNDSVPSIKIDGEMHYIDLRLSEEFLPLDLKPPKRGDRISDWLIKQLKDLRYVYHFEGTTLCIGRKEATAISPKVFSNSISIEKKKGDYSDCFWYKSDPYLMFLKKDYDANKPFHDIRVAKNGYYTAKDNAPELLNILNRVFTLNNNDGSVRFVIEKFTYRDRYVVMLRFVGDWVTSVNMEFDKVFHIPNFEDERALHDAIAATGGTYTHDGGTYDEVSQEGVEIRWNDWYESAIPGSWRVLMPRDEYQPSTGYYTKHGFILAQGNASSENTDTYQVPNGWKFFEGIGRLKPLYSDEKTVSHMEVDSQDYGSVNLLDRVCFGVERIARPQICTEKVLTMEDGQIHYDIKVDDQMQIQ